MTLDELYDVEPIEDSEVIVPSKGKGTDLKTFQNNQHCSQSSRYS
jgi:hypothetical protein